MATAHIVRIKRTRELESGPQFISRTEVFPPAFPDLSTADRYAQEYAKTAGCALRIFVEEKRTGRRKVEYCVDGSGRVERIPLLGKSN